MKKGLPYEAKQIVRALHSGENRHLVHVNAKGGAHMDFEEPTCIHCGCTQLNACVDGLGQGCSWVNVDSRTNRGHCSACRNKGLKFYGEEEVPMAARKIKGKTKKRPASKRRDTAAQSQSA
jgi:hypothetical protein